MIKKKLLNKNFDITKFFFKLQDNHQIFTICSDSKINYIHVEFFKKSGKTIENLAKIRHFKINFKFFVKIGIIFKLLSSKFFDKLKNRECI